MSITLISVIYLTSVLIIYSSVKSSLEVAIDKKTLNNLVKWQEFIIERPEGTEIKLELKIYPGRWLTIFCSDSTHFETPSTEFSSEIKGRCLTNVMNISKTKLITLTKFEGGVLFEEL